MTSEHRVPIADLHKLFRYDDGAIICGGCLRKWRAVYEQGLNQANFDYLEQHADDHIRQIKHKLGDNTKKILGQ